MVWAERLVEMLKISEDWRVRAREDNHWLSSQNQAGLPPVATNQETRLLALYESPVDQKSKVVPYWQYDCPDIISNVKSPQYEPDAQFIQDHHEAV